jgi:DNA-directed RNA polymerase subunit H (RpoH/RPB5)
MSVDINAFIPELLPIEKSHHQQLNDVKTNLIKMLINRNFIKKENENKYIDKIIKEENDDQEYIINLDNESNCNTIIKSKKIIIKILDYKISSIAKNSPIGEFILKNSKDYKIIIVQDINHKSENIIYSYDTPTEIFKLSELMINVVDHVLVPNHILLSKEDGHSVLQAYNAKKIQMPLIRSNDPIARYYNMKGGDIVKIIRPSVMTCEAPAYRLVIKSKESKVKT